MSSHHPARFRSLLATTLVSGFLVAGSASGTPVANAAQVAERAGGSSCSYAEKAEKQTRRPGRPPKVVVTQKGSNGAKITWTAAKRMTWAPFEGVQDTYVVQFQQDGGQWGNAGETPAVICNTRAYGIGASHYFKFRVAGVNENGRGPWAVTEGKFRLQ